jgi:osmotically-inducible protein OsmY
MTRIFKTGLMVCFTWLMIACSNSAPSESAGEFVDSSAVTAKVKANLVDQLGTNGFLIQVKTYKNDVQLSGYVDDGVVKTRAGAIAANTIDVKRVHNNLIVK